MFPLEHAHLIGPLKDYGVSEQKVHQGLRPNVLVEVFVLSYLEFIQHGVVIDDQGAVWVSEVHYYLRKFIPEYGVVVLNHSRPKGPDINSLEDLHDEHEVTEEGPGHREGGGSLALVVPEDVVGL